VNFIFRAEHIGMLQISDVLAHVGMTFSSSNNIIRETLRDKGISQAVVLQSRECSTEMKA
jgi:hypothetical protein